MPLMTADDFKFTLGESPVHMVSLLVHLEKFIKPLVAALDAYHSTWDNWLTYYGSSKQSWSDARLAALDEAEHLTYEVLDLERDRIAHGKKPRMLLMQLLAQLQEAHIEAVDYVHQKNLKLYIPDRSKLKKQEEQQLDADWDLLRKGTGAVKLPTGKNVERANRELRAIHARLLSRPHGRGLLRWILDKPQGKEWPVKIVFTQEFTPSLQFRQQVVLNKQTLAKLGTDRKQLVALNSQMSERIREIEQKNPMRDREKGKEYMQRLASAVPEYAEALKAQSEVDDKIAQIDTEIPKYGEDEHGLLYAVSEPAPGIAGKEVEGGSNLRLRVGLRDNAQRNYAADSHPIPAPAFIVYGHELVHVLQHRYPKKMVLNPEVYGSVHQKHKYENTSEHEAIRALKKHRTADHIPFYENLLRSEHKLSLRKHHTGTTAFDLGEGE